MSMSNHLAGYLEQRGAQYGVCGHAYSRSSAETARSANIMPNLFILPEFGSSVQV